MIKLTQVTVSNPLSGLEAFIDQYEDVAFSEFSDVVSEVEPLMLADLREPVPPSNGVDPWTSAKQRRAYFATDGFGKGIPYRRTGKLQQGWNVTVDKTDNGFAVVVSNPAESAKFVVGSLAQNRGDALRFMQRFHMNTGWQPAHDTVYYWVDVINEEFADRIKNIGTSDSFKRAYTQGTKRA